MGATMEPETRYEKSDQTLSGSRVGVRAALFSVDGKPHGGVTLTVRVPGDFAQTGTDGGVSATLLLNPDEGLAIADWLREAFHAVDREGPPLYRDPAGGS
jgi:hypothetical protein